MCRDTISFEYSAYSQHACKLGNPACTKSLTLDLRPDQTSAQTIVSLTVLSLVFSVPSTDCRLTPPVNLQHIGLAKELVGK